MNQIAKNVFTVDLVFQISPFFKISSNSSRQSRVYLTATLSLPMPTSARAFRQCGSNSKKPYTNVDTNLLSHIFPFHTNMLSVMVGTRLSWNTVSGRTANTRGGMRDESSKKSNPNGRRTQKSAHKRAEREPKSEEKKKEKRRTKMNE